MASVPLWLMRSTSRVTRSSLQATASKLSITFGHLGPTWLCWT
jgi:hypothetical protein